MRFYLKMSACIIYVIAYGFVLFLYPIWGFTFVMGVPVCNWLANLCHEFGHFIAYRLLGLEWKRMVVSCFVAEAGKGIRIERKNKLFAAGCTCKYQPERSYGCYAVALLSGGVFGLILSVASITACFFLEGGLRAFFLCFAIVNTLNALANLIFPFSTDRVLLKQIKQEKENKM